MPAPRVSSTFDRRGKRAAAQARLGLLFDVRWAAGLEMRVCDTGQTRREFLRIAATIPILGASPHLSTSRGAVARSVEVVVVGAGLAGLTAARDLLREGVDVAVLEARGRVGGRTYTQAVRSGMAVEAGGMWVGPGQDVVRSLASEYGIETFRNPSGGDLVYLEGADRYVLAPGRSAETEAMFDRIDALAGAMERESWTSPQAVALDSLTVLDWLKNQNVSAGTVEEVVTEAATTIGDPAATSMLWFLTIVNSAGGLRRLSDVSGGAQEARFVGGAQAISSAIAEELGDRIKLEAPVTRITSSTSSVEVESGGKSIDAQIAIVAMMPGDAERIRFSPELPAQRRELQSRWVASAGAKATVRYSGPFWRDQGLSGTAFSSDHAVGFVIDITPPDQPEGWVAIFLDHLPPGRTPRDVIIEGLTLLFGPRAADPLSVDVHDWSADPWTAGCVSALPPGVLTALGDALRAPVGRIHWAGTETADRWIGYMDGAVRSGQRVASEVLTALHHIRTGGG